MERAHSGPRERCRASRRPSIRRRMSEIRRAAATGIYDIRGGGAKRRVPEFRRSAVSRRFDVALSARGLQGEMRNLGRARRPLREEADRTENSDHHRRHEFRLALRAGQGSARPRRLGRRNLDDDRRRRHDAGRARPFVDPRLSISSLALRHEPRRSAPGGRHRGGGRPRRKARRRRHAARPEDLEARRR